MNQPVSVSVDYAGHLVVNGERQSVHFTRKEEQFLRLIFTSKGVTTREFALSILYPPPSREPEMKILDVYVVKLRGKLGEHRTAIETVWGRGWARGADFIWEEPNPDLVTVEVRQDRLADLILFTGKSAEVIVDELIAKAHLEVVGVLS